MSVLVVLTVCLAVWTTTTTQAPVEDPVSLDNLVGEGQYTLQSLSTKDDRVEKHRVLRQAETVNIEEKVRLEKPRLAKLTRRAAQTVRLERGGEEADLLAVLEEMCGPRDFQCSIRRVLAAAMAGPTPVDLTGSYSGRRRRSPQQEPPHANAHQYGLQEPNIADVKVKNRGKYGRVVMPPVVVTREDQTNFLNGAKERRKRSENYVPFSVYDERRVKVLKVEQNDFLALHHLRSIELEKLQSAPRRVEKRQFGASQ